jgi:hypothetical protein
MITRIDNQRYILDLVYFLFGYVFISPHTLLPFIIAALSLNQVWSRELAKLFLATHSWADR